tara:strand:+ start:50702 stop:51163 length:462 start_codon:yes stop_codon:yes gene_type:complete
MSLFKRLRRRHRANAAAGSDMDLVTANRIVHDYRKRVEDAPPYPGVVQDDNTLPHAKQAIKEAIMVCLAHSRDRAVITQLRYALLLLPAWQAGVGDEPQPISDQGNGLSLETRAFLAQFGELSTDSTSNWAAIVEAEREQLAAELRNFSKPDD